MAVVAVAAEEEEEEEEDGSEERAAQARRLPPLRSGSDVDEDGETDECCVARAGSRLSTTGSLISNTAASIKDSKVFIIATHAL